MRLGPIQLVIIGFDNDDNFRGQIARELDALKGRGVVKLIDLIFAHKTDAGQLTITTRTDIEPEDEAAYGPALERLLGAIEAEGIPLDVLPDDDDAVGIGLAELRDNLAGVKPGRAVAIAIFEHTWAAGLSHAIGEAGGRLLTQGILTREAVMLMGDELESIAQSEAKLTAAHAVKGAAVLDALIYDDSPDGDTDQAMAVVEEATSMLTTAVAAETLRTLMVAGVVDDSEVELALVALIENGLLEPERVERSLEAADSALAQASQPAELA